MIVEIEIEKEWPECKNQFFLIEKIFSIKGIDVISIFNRNTYYGRKLPSIQRALKIFKAVGKKPAKRRTLEVLISLSRDQLPLVESGQRILGLCPSDFIYKEKEKTPYIPCIARDEGEEFPHVFEFGTTWGIENCEYIVFAVV